MRKVLGVALMLIPLLAWAGDKLIGTVIVTDAGTASNRTTGYTAYACPANVNGGCFLVGSPTILDVQCDEDCLVCTDLAGCDAGSRDVAANINRPTVLADRQELQQRRRHGW